MEPEDTFSSAQHAEMPDDQSVDVNSEADLWKVATLIMMNSDLYGQSMHLGSTHVLGRSDVTLIKEWGRTGKVRLFLDPYETEN